MSTSEKATTPGLERAVGLKEAVALNFIEIVGNGPFVVSALVIRAMGGPQALLAWLGGALLAALDGFVWSELGAAMPKAGGTYVFLREAYGPEKWGRLMSFLFVWQTLIQAPLSVASASIGTRTKRTSTGPTAPDRSEEHTSELQSRFDLVC